MLRILYNSRDLSHKVPFGTVTPGQLCTLRVHIPQHCHTQKSLCRLLREDGTLLPGGSHALRFRCAPL